MEKRIRLIYILSLLVALTAIGVQVYWLYNQYRFVTDLYAEELARKVLQAGEEEFQVRKKRAFVGETSYVFEHKTEVNKSDSLSKKKSTATFHYNFDEQVAPHLSDSSENPVNKMHISFNPSLPEDSIMKGIERGVTEYYQPFSSILLDSLLYSSLPQHTFCYLPLEVTDTASCFSTWRLLPGHLFPPHLGVVYYYAPLNKSGVIIETVLPVNPLITKMGGQVLVSLLLIFLLLACLAFLIKTILKQKKIGEMREGFVHTMVHELRRPVQTLKMCISFLQDKEMRTDEAASDEVVQDALFELDNLSAYLGKLKDMVSADGGATLLHPVFFDLQELVEKVIRLIPLPSGKQVTFSTAFSPAFPPVKADPVHVANVLSNLIENAVKYSGPEVEIQVIMMSDNKGLELKVSDNGFGISPEEQQRVFDKFYRSIHLPDTHIPGLGLGLSYVRQIAEAHNGQVFLRSEIGKGTEVKVRIPQ